MEQDKPLISSVAVAVCTRGRPEMLQSTLQSLACLELDGIDCRYIIIENNNIHTVASVVDELAGIVGDIHVTYQLEPRLGIAYARNAALEAALGMKVDALAFIDDDETADPQWLIKLVELANKDQLDLAGGPVSLQAVPQDASTSEKMVWRGLNARRLELDAKSSRFALKGKNGRITITTGNWLGDLKFIRRTNLRFDETLNLSGGEDTAFFRALREAGGKTGWTAEAITRESLPRDRLTLDYQFRRARDQALARHRAKYPSPGLIAYIVISAVILFKAVGGTLRIVQSIFDGGASLVRAARAFGAIVGITNALRGRHSNHYASVSGH